ncbi:FxsA family protein [Aestuariivirga sp.]|uniref:FxsA family protein n=1 Tax=Aestuariivirga sp. TaxID=2650926 RepID=UPI00391953D9
MTRYLPFLILAGIAAEIASIIWVGDGLGVAVTLLLLLAGGVAGIGLIKSAGTSLADTLRSPVQGASLQEGLAGETVARVLSGLLLLIPGFFSDVLAVLLLLPPVRRWFRARLAMKPPAAGSAPARRFETMIEGEVVDVTIDPETPQPPPGRDP